MLHFVTYRVALCIIRGRRKTKDLISEDNPLHVNMHQTEQLATVECEITTWKAPIWGFVENVKVDTETVPLILFYNQRLQCGRLALVYTRSIEEEWVANGRKVKNRKLVCSTRIFYKNQARCS